MLYFHSLQAYKNQGLTGLAADSRRYGKITKTSAGSLCYPLRRVCSRLSTRKTIPDKKSEGKYLLPSTFQSLITILLYTSPALMSEFSLPPLLVLRSISSFPLDSLWSATVYFLQFHFSFLLMTYTSHPLFSDSPRYSPFTYRICSPSSKNWPVAKLILSIGYIAFPSP